MNIATPPTLAGTVGYMGMKSLLFIIFSIPSYVFSGDSVVTLNGDFEGNGEVSYFKYNPANMSYGVDYYSSSKNKTYHYTVDVKGECGLLQLYKPNKAENKIVIDGSCMGQGAEVHEYIYEWSKENNRWCLRSEVTGEKSDVTSGAEADLTTTDVGGCRDFGKAED